MAVSQNMVRADVFQKCWQFGKIICPNEISGLIRSLKFPTFWFEPTPQGLFM
ncbi:MAG: hypothetical protein UX66_C0008G0001, partial [Parcubacteria group bacterium GW2011_GWF2_46_8]